MRFYAIRDAHGKIFPQTISRTEYEARWAARYRAPELVSVSPSKYVVAALVPTPEPTENHSPDVYSWFIERPDGSLVTSEYHWPTQDVWFAWCDAVRVDLALNALNEAWRKEHDGKSFFHAQFEKQDEFEGYKAVKVYLVEET